MNEKQIEQEAEVYALQESQRYVVKHPKPDDYPQDQFDKLVMIFKNQCKSDYIAGRTKSLSELTALQSEVEKLREDEWVSVEEDGLPKERIGHYLVCDMTLPEYRQMVYIATWYSESQSFVMEIPLTPTHYKPLPPLPSKK